MQPHHDATSKRPEQPSPGDDERAHPLQDHLDAMLMRLQIAAQAQESETRTQEIEDVTSEYILGLLEGAVPTDGMLEARLVTKGARTKEETWVLDSPLFAFLANELGKSMPTRIAAFQGGQYKSAAEFNAGLLKQVRNLVLRYEPPRNTYADRRRRPEPPSAPPPMAA